MKKIKNGFTLLELLVVIGIIGILVALATVSYSSAQKGGRDSKRKQDLISMQNALEQYYSATSYVYPTTCSSAATLYMKSSWPVDPTNTSPYTYAQSCTESTYCICATMEKITAGNSTTPTLCNGWTSSGPYYCVANLQ